MRPMTKRIENGQTVAANGEAWRVVGVGASEAGATYVHLASETRGTTQKSGKFSPVQCCGWLRGESLSSRP